MIKLVTVGLLLLGAASSAPTSAHAAALVIPDRSTELKDMPAAVCTDQFLKGSGGVFVCADAASTPTFFSRWYKSAQVNGVLVIGHSFVRGASATTPETGGWPALLDSQLKSAFGDGGGGYYGLPAQGGTPSENFNKITFTGSWVGHTPGVWQLNYYATGSGRTAALTVNGSMLKVLYNESDYSSIYTISVDSGTPVNYGQNLPYCCDGNVRNVAADSVSLGTGGNHTILLTTTNIYYLLGFAAVNTTGATVYRMGLDGALAYNMTGANSWNLAFIDQLAPQLTIIEVGINDWTAQTPLLVFASQIETIVKQARKSGQCAIVSEPEFNQTVREIPLKAYNDWLFNISVKYDCAWVDMASRWGTITQGVASGYQTATNNGHPTDAGHTDIANQVYDAIVNH